MATVREILGKKGSEIISVPPSETVVKAAQLMNERGIGGLVVTEGKRLAGIFTERDILRRVVAQRRDPAVTKVADVMTSPVTACAPETTVEECAAMMTAKRIRHLPVVGEKGLVGVITIGDVLAFQVSEQQATIDYMHHFMFDLR
ncbi:MAG: histidine kinase [Gemmatimonadetes bacterium]|nr:MAG: histidine kinase [Gemmatimonadota bacterium]PYO74194.1 MAG: histidine kinase [Gemmatimonadota bacterium]PYO98760.1 MAG: histidine kinase [Gemmatimonadota bacterium]TLY49840.1 MAG: CBS domain-containing protein [Gemmatimonadota bacterium]